MVKEDEHGHMDQHTCQYPLNDIIQWNIISKELGF